MSFRTEKDLVEPLKVREDGIEPEEADHTATKAGIKVRMQRSDGGNDEYDIAWLNRESLYRHLRSKGGRNDYAEDVVAKILGHEPGGRPE